MKRGFERQLSACVAAATAELESNGDLANGASISQSSTKHVGGLDTTVVVVGARVGRNQWGRDEAGIIDS